MRPSERSEPGETIDARTPRRSGWIAWTACVLAVVALAAPARAQESGAGAIEEERPSPQPTQAAITRAREHFDVALSLYRTGRFREAAVEFQRAYSLSGAPELLHNLYLAYRDSGDLAAAAAALRQYLDVEREISDEQRSILEHRLEALEAASGHAAAEDGGRSAAGDEHEGERGAEGEDEGEAEAGPDPEPAAPPPGTGSSEQPWGAIASFSIAGLGAVMLGVTGSLALAERGALETRCAPRCADAEVEGVRTLGILADVGLGVAVAGAIAGVVLLAVGEGARGDASVSLVPLAGPTYAGLVLEGRL